jgi:predicted metal-binding protein
MQVPIYTRWTKPLHLRFMLFATHISGKMLLSKSGCTYVVSLSHESHRNANVFMHLCGHIRPRSMHSMCRTSILVQPSVVWLPRPSEGEVCIGTPGAVQGELQQKQGWHFDQVTEPAVTSFVNCEGCLGSDVADQRGGDI